MTKKTGIELIAEERREQIEKHGYTADFVKSNPEYYERNQMSYAASILCASEWGCLDEDDISEDFPPLNWPEDEWDKMVRKPYNERLIIAGALIAAELDRINSVSEHKAPAEKEYEHRIEGSRDGKTWRTEGIFPAGSPSRFGPTMNETLMLREAESFVNVRGSDFKGVRVVTYIK